MKKHDLLASTEPLDPIGQNLARMLSQSCGDLPHDLSERLRIARVRALAVRKPEPAPRFELAAQGNRLVLGGPPSEGPGLWGILGSVLPLLALLVGLVTVQWLDGEQTVSDLAEIDTALLVDDLPPTAYSDPGFMQFLRQSGSESRPQD